MAAGLDRDGTVDSAPSLQGLEAEELGYLCIMGTDRWDHLTRCCRPMVYMCVGGETWMLQPFLCPRT